MSSRKPRKGNAQAVSDRRRKVKAILVEEAGGKCIDCGYIGPDFMYDFDHRNPEEKVFTLGHGNSISLDRMKKEASKCDLVCALCHRMRTHKQRCSGCNDCIKTMPGGRLARQQAVNLRNEGSNPFPAANNKERVIAERLA